MEDLEKRMQKVDHIPDHQPQYPDMDALYEAMAEVHNTRPTVTTPDSIDQFAAQLAERVQIPGAPIYIAGRCNNLIDAHTPIDHHVEESERLFNAVTDVSANGSIVILRDRNQSAKPRSKPTEMIDGIEVESYKGDMINGYDPNDRTPDPSRMVAAAVQSRDIEQRLTSRLGHHVYAAHEALLLPFEESSIYTHNGKQYLLSADMPWIGERTRHVEGEHVALLSRIENPVGVKVSAKATPEDIRDLAESLNPDLRPGKLTFMLRLGVENMTALPDLLQAIKEHAPESIIMCDAVHGNTFTQANGIKTRLVSDIIEEIQVTAMVCKEFGLRLHGVHLEAMGTNQQKECIDTPDEMIAHDSKVDPNLNIDQLRRIIRETRAFL